MKKFVLISGFLVFCCIAIQSYAVSTRSVCNSTCETTKANCNGGALTGSNGKLTGCTKSGTGCAGSCYRCTSGAGDDFCEAGGSGCLIPTTSPASTSCGNRKKFSCGGTWSSGCTCPSTGGTATTTSCDPVICYG